VPGVTVVDSPATEAPSPAPSPSSPTDAIVIGGGLVGGALAVALAAEGARVAVVEAAGVGDGGIHPRHPRSPRLKDCGGDESGGGGGEDAQVSFDARNVALADAARRWFATLGVWDDIAPHAQAIADIHISERGGFGMTHLTRAHAGACALGFVAPTRVIGRALHRRLRAGDGVDFYCPARATGLRVGQSAAEVDIEFPVGDDTGTGTTGTTTAADTGTGTGTVTGTTTVTLTAPLVVLADGGRSALAAQAGLSAARATAYNQVAIACVIAADRAHNGRAYERFTAEGPLALLPHRAHAGRGFAVVWAGEPAAAAARMALDDADFTAALQAAFGERAGRFASASPRAQYPLRFGRASSPTAKRAVSIGNAAHLVHPVAAQGLNLGLRDAAALAALVGRAKRAGRDPGGAEVLAEYASLRRRETARVVAFTDGLIRVFGARAPVIRLARNFGLAGLECCPPAKRFLLRRTMGTAALAGLAGG